MQAKPKQPRTLHSNRVRWYVTYLKERRGCCVPSQSNNLIVVGEKLFDEVLANKAGGSCDENFHFGMKGHFLSVICLHGCIRLKGAPFRY